MNINPRKLKKEKNDITLNIHDLNIVKAKQIKPLGVIIDNDLNFTEHNTEICTKASKRVGLLNRLGFGIWYPAGQNSCCTNDLSYHT